MKLNDLLAMFDIKKKQWGEDAYLHISELFEEAREKYKEEYLTSPKAQKIRAQGKTPDAEQSWKAFKGKNFEKLILHAIGDKVKPKLNLCCIPGSWLARKKISKELERVYHNLTIRYGKWALLPDIDLVIYEPNTFRVIGVISCKITLRERIAQTAYWKLKLASDPLRMHIKGYFVTADEDGDLVRGMIDPTRNRIIVEHELDGTYALRHVAESNKVKAFPKLVDDIGRLVNENKK